MNGQDYPGNKVDAQPPNILVERKRIAIFFRVDQAPEYASHLKDIRRSTEKETMRGHCPSGLRKHCVLAKEAKPNVLFIVIDDMNDGISLLDSKSPIKTPNIERLAKRGMSPCLLYLRRLQSVACCHAYRSAPQL